MIRPPPRYTQSRASAASDVYKRQALSGVQYLQINGWLRPSASPTKYVGSPFAQLPFPLGNLVGMHFKPLRQFGHRLVTCYRRQRYFGFEYRRVRPSRSFCHFLLHIKSPQGPSKGSRFSTYRLVQVPGATSETLFEYPRSKAHWKLKLK